MLKYLGKNKLLIILLLLVIVMGPLTISLPEQSRSESIVTGIGIDKNNNEYEVTIQYIVPSAGGEENLKTTSAKGESVGKIFEALTLEIGKTLGFAHCRFLAFSESAGSENLTKILDYLLRQKTNANNIVLIQTQNANDLLSTAKGVDSDLYTFLSNSGYSNELKENNQLTTIGDFYKSYFGLTKCLNVYVLNTKTSPASSGSNGGGDSSSIGTSSGGSGSANENEKVLENKQQLAIIKGNKLLKVLTQEESNNLIWFNKNVKRLKLQVNNFEDKTMGNVDYLIEIFKRKVKANICFENGIPHYKLTIKNYVRSSELVSENLTEKNYETARITFTEELINSMKNVCLQKLKSAEAHFKENNYDVINCYDKFYKFKNKELKQYLKTHSKETFIKDVVFDYDISFVQGS